MAETAITIPLYGVVHLDAMEAAAAEVLRSGCVASGEKVAELEQALASALGLPDAAQLVTVADASNAVDIALRLAGVQAGDEVLTTAFACLSTNAPIAAAGARPVWVDIDPVSGNMDPQALTAAIQQAPRARAVIVYHVAGYPAALDAIANICRQHGLTLIEDANAALGATIDCKPVGTRGDFGVLSFYPNRQLNGGGGGALICRDPQHAARARRLRRYGIDLPRFRRADGEIDPACDVAEIGWPAAMTNLAAALALAQMDSLDERLAQARGNAARIAARLHGLPGVRVVPLLPGADPACWACLIHADDWRGLHQHLRAAGMQSSQLHMRNDLYTGFGPPRGPNANLPGTDAFMSSVLALPCGAWLNTQAVDNLCHTIEDWTRRA